MEERKLNIVFISLIAINSIDEKHLYSDLMRTFINMGHHVDIFTPIERGSKFSNKFIEGKNYTINRITTPKLQKTNLIEKGIGMFVLDFLFLRYVKKIDFKNVDLLVYSTPPITIVKTIKYFKQKYKTATYLLLKDIFPQNAVDLGMMSKNSFIYKYFLNTEKSLYKLSDNIGCMSQANVDYIMSHNPELHPLKVHINPNSIEISSNNFVFEKQDLRQSLGLPKTKRIFIYGGNFGKPQAIDYIIALLDHKDININTYFIFIGSGTEQAKIKAAMLNSDKAIFIEYLPKQDFDKYVAASDFGLIFLDARFTIPNFPSRLLSYMTYSLPTLCFVDKATDIGISAKLNGFGDFAFSGSIEEGVNLINKYAVLDTKSMLEMGSTAHLFLKNNYTIDISANKILNTVIK